MRRRVLATSIHDEQKWGLVRQLRRWRMAFASFFPALPFNSSLCTPFLSVHFLEAAESTQEMAHLEPWVERNDHL